MRKGPVRPEADYEANGVRDLEEEGLNQEEAARSGEMEGQGEGAEEE